MAIQFHKVQQGNLPVNVIGDHVYFTDTGRMYVSQANGSLKEIQDLTEINAKMEVLNSGRGYLYSSVITDMNLVIDNGKYKTYNALNSPVPNSTILLDVTRSEKENICIQLATVAFGPAYYIGTTYSRVKGNGGVWSDWRQFATTDEIDIILDGEVTSGNITLSKSINNYDYVIFITKTGASTLSYTIEGSFVDGYSKSYIGINNKVSTFTISNGGLTLNGIDYTAGNPRQIKGVKRGRF